MNLLKYLLKSEGQLPETIIVPITQEQDRVERFLSLSAREYTIEQRQIFGSFIVVVNYGILGESWVPAHRVRVLTDNTEQTKTDSPQYGC